MLGGLSDQEQRDLKRLLGHYLATTEFKDLGLVRLGLLTEMTAAGLDPSTGDYEREREIRKARGEEWPAASTLTRAYGHWLVAQSAAEQLVHKTRRRGTADPANARERDYKYNEQDVTDAIRQCAKALRAWPTVWEFHEARVLGRAAARRAGNVERVRVPAHDPIRRLFRGYDNALAAAKRAEAGEREPDSALEELVS